VKQFVASLVCADWQSAAGYHPVVMALRATKNDENPIGGRPILAAAGF
jgi:hypothetical protein